MAIENVTIGEAKRIAAMFAPVNLAAQGGGGGGGFGLAGSIGGVGANPFLGRRVLIRTYSAGVHIGTLVTAYEMTAHLKNSLRLWSWTGGGLSLSAVATNGIKGGRLNRAPEIFLTNAIEIIPVSTAAEASFVKYIED